MTPLRTRPLNSELDLAELLKDVRPSTVTVQIARASAHEKDSIGAVLAQRMGELLALLSVPLSEHDLVSLDFGGVSSEGAADGSATGEFLLAGDAVLKRDFLIQFAGQNPNRIRWASSQLDAAGFSWALPPASSSLPLLAPQTPSRQSHWLRKHLAQVPWESLGVSDSLERTALWAGIWQMNDFLDESHQQSQKIEGEGIDRNGDYWHAIMHRREPDFGNSKYWFRRVGTHPVFQPLSELAKQVLQAADSPDAQRWLNRLCPQDRWDAMAFVDLCEACHRQESAPLGLIARQLQRAEMLLLLDHSWRSTGAGARSSGTA